MAVVTFTTDFGTRDGYAAAMKGVVLALAPGATLVDITHDVPAQDVVAGAFALAQAAPLFPPGTIHVVVVDPGVGGDRADLVVEAGHSFYVGPDNGVLSLALRGPRVVRRIDNRAWRREPVSPTFHGRDVFAPAAGRLAAGEPAHDAGAALPAMIELEGAAGARVGDPGEIVHVDRFGNLITSFLAGDLAPGPLWLEIADRERRWPLVAARTFSDVASGALVAFDGSAGRVEVAVRDGSAAAHTGLRRGDRIRLRRSGS